MNQTPARANLERLPITVEELQRLGNLQMRTRGPYTRQGLIKTVAMNGHNATFEFFWIREALRGQWQECNDKQLAIAIMEMTREGDGTVRIHGGGIIVLVYPRGHPENMDSQQRRL